MGLRPLDLRRWTEPPPPEALLAELERKERLVADRPAEVSHATAGSERAGAELLERLTAHLLADHPSRYRLGPGRTVVVDGSRSVDLGRWTPLQAAALLVADDWCLIRPGLPPVLAAGVVCSPNRWRLSAKVGRPLAAVHGPVPGYAAELAAPVDRLVGRREAGRPVWRQNWSLMARPDLFQPDAEPDAAFDVPTGVWVRSERQTIVWLPRTGWPVFGIATAQEPLGAVARRPDLARRLLTVVTNLDPATAAYKELDGCRAPLVAWLTATACSLQATQEDE
jgi:hypothetical protein